MSKMAISYRKNAAYDEGELQAPRLIAGINLNQYGIDGRVTDLPIYFRNLETSVGPLRVVYSTHIAGLTLETGNLEALANTIDKVLRALIRRERLPQYVFHVGNDAWPIYQLRGELITRYPGGPVFMAASIAELWIALADHFKHIGRIDSRRDLGILYFCQSDLQLYAPEFSLRFPTAADIPVFPVANGNDHALLAPIGKQVLELPIDGGREVMTLYRQVGERLTADGRLAGPYDISIRKLANSRWAAARGHLRSTGRALTYYADDHQGILRRHHVPVFGGGQGYLAVYQGRPTRVTVYAGPDLPTLQARVGEELYQRGLIDSPGALYLGTALPETSSAPSILDQVLHRETAIRR